MRRVIGIIAGIIGCILTAWVVAVVSGANVFENHVNVIAGSETSILKYSLSKSSFKCLIIVALAGILLVIISYIILFKKKK